MGEIRYMIVLNGQCNMINMSLVMRKRVFRSFRPGHT